MIALKSPKDGQANRSAPILHWISPAPKPKPKGRPPKRKRNTEKWVADQPDKKTKQSRLTPPATLAPSADEPEVTEVKTKTVHTNWSREPHKTKLEHAVRTWCDQSLEKNILRKNLQREGAQCIFFFVDQQREWALYFFFFLSGQGAGILSAGIFNITLMKATEVISAPATRYLYCLEFIVGIIRINILIGACLSKKLF